jgi:hypothetical protein
MSSSSSSSFITDERTLREIADRACKKIYIGAAVLPKPLFVLDHDDDDAEVHGGDVSSSVCLTVHFYHDLCLKHEEQLIEDWYFVSVLMK